MSDVPSIVNHFTIYLADQMEKDKSLKERRLPEGLKSKPNSIISPECNKDVALAYLLSDVIYTLMWDVCRQLQESGSDLRFETKRKFNELFRAAKLFKDKASAMSKDFELLGNSGSYDELFEDSERMLKYIKEFI